MHDMGTISMTDFNRQVSAITRRVVEGGETIRVTNRGKVVLRLVPEAPHSENSLDMLTAANLASAPTKPLLRVSTDKKVELSADLDDLLDELNADIEI